MRITKDITIVSPASAETKFKGQVFHSYRAVAKALKPTDEVTVRVVEKYGKGPHDHVLAGFGEVTGVQNGTYTEPRRLAHDY